MTAQLSGALAALFIGSLCAAAPVENLKTIDRYGQFTGEEWPGKVTSDDQLRADAEREWKILKNLAPDTTRYDRFGGRLEGTPRKATGYFRVEKIDGRWWFITPEGNRFFLQGVDAVSWRETGYNTPLLNVDSRPRKEFLELPERARFQEAYHTQGKVNFLAGNLKRKYGPDFDRKFRDIARRRFLAWGFNSTAKWGWGESIGLPFIEDSHAGPVRRIGEKYRAIDMYDPDFAAKIEPAVKAVCDRRRGDPMLIAYSMENENGWSEELVALLLQEPADCFAKGAFLDFLAQKRGGDFAGVAELFDRPGENRAGLLAAKLESAGVPVAEVREFINLSSQRYHRILRELFRKHDPYHMFMGAAHCPKQSVDWYEGAAKYVDFLGFNIYGLSLGWVDRDMDRLMRADTPFTVLEYSFVTEGRGYPGYSGNNTVRSQADRGTGFRLFTEGAAVNPLCIGFGYFIYWDQPVTRRGLPDGEAFNFGLVNQCDQPYEEMLTAVKAANAKLFDLHDGKGTPFTIPTPRSILGSAKSRALTDLFLPGTQSEFVVFDPSNRHYFNGESARLKVDENSVKEPGVYPAGILSSGDGQRYTDFELKVYLWKKSADQNPVNHFSVEESSDGKTYTPVKLKAAAGAPSEFNEWLLSPASGLKKGTSYLKISFKIGRVQESWAAQFGRIKLKTEP
ncbi:hypothetical protein [uncultured Victivallis sp.]|uniref:hypothetical protein n=1 Tax=uncultured Victivallis sp. TaxID=354118 RepID=UPI002600D84B|nr:hypothetical protein [uncultured Victivallis sp.]